MGPSLAARGSARAALIDAARVEAAAMEDAGAVHLAYALLTHVQTLAGDEGDGVAGRVLVQRARAARHLGDADVARHLYARAAALGRRIGDVELQARSALGRAALATARGNYPLAGRLYRRALNLCVAGEGGEVECLALQGLMIVAATSGRMERALQLGWRSFQAAAGDGTREAELLLNLAGVCADTGRSGTALAAYLAALHRTTVTRLVVLALGCAVREAARLEAYALFHRLEGRLRPLLEGEGFVLERTAALLNLGEAYGLVGRMADSTACVARAEREGKRFGYYEIVHRAGEIPARLAEKRIPHGVAPPPAPPAVQRVLAGIEALGVAAEV
ncbi:MAG: hypothetical protein NVS9B3_04920 [Gemmatimonadaceae bacterium]